MKIESNKNWTTCLRLNTGDGSPRVFLLNSHFLGSVPIPAGVSFCIGHLSSLYAPLLEEFKAFPQNKKHKLNSDYEVS